MVQIVELMDVGFWTTKFFILMFKNEKKNHMLVLVLY
jgi:hypothetical protein